MVSSSEIPDDENGYVLKQMLASGDDLSKSRRIDFTVVFPDYNTALQFKELIVRTALDVSVEHTGTVDALPWDVIVSFQMVPNHDEIGAIEARLESVAKGFGGRNDGWGCFEPA
jgi:hypothetical protein